MEKVILVNDLDEELGEEEKIKAHIQGKKHRAFSIFIINEKNQMLLQKRNKNKYHSGGLWTNACCSHPRPNEETINSAKRRLFEEMGFQCNLKKAFSFSYKKKFQNGLTENEFDHVFLGNYQGEVTPDLKEAEAHRWSSINEIETDLKKNPQKYTYWFKTAFPKIISFI